MPTSVIDCTVRIPIVLFNVIGHKMTVHILWSIQCAMASIILWLVAPAAAVECVCHNCVCLCEHMGLQLCLAHEIGEHQTCLHVVGHASHAGHASAMYEQRQACKKHGQACQQYCTYLMHSV